MSATHPTPVLPPPLAAPVSDETRLAYVLRHFRLAYEAIPDVTIGYAATQPNVAVINRANGFFQTITSCPPTPNYREWAGQRVPFFFDNQSDTTLLTLTTGRAIINADVISAAFFLLSGWQEYFSDTRDQHGRFPYSASVQQRYGFVALPVVNYYFDVLKTAVEHITGHVLQPRRWATGASFAAFVTHDIDNLRSAWKASAKAAFQHKQLMQLGQLAWQRCTQADAWDNLEAVAATTEAYGAKSTFFILPEHRPGADGTPNADYKISASFRQRLVKLKERGGEIGLHGSIGTAVHGPQLGLEMKTLQHNTLGLRFHYLGWEPRITPGIVDATHGVCYDSTLGFAEHFGFRHSYCQPFYPYNFTTGRTHTFLEIPLNVMDTTLHHPNYLQLRAEEILPALHPMFEEIERFGGVVTVLWHNDHFDPTNTVTGPSQFTEIMSHLRKRGAAFLTGSQILTELSPQIVNGLIS